MNCINLSCRPYLYTMIHLFFGVIYALRHSGYVKALTFIAGVVFKMLAPSPHIDSNIVLKMRRDERLPKCHPERSEGSRAGPRDPSRSLHLSKRMCSG